MPQVTIDIPAGAIRNSLIHPLAGIEPHKFIRHQSIDAELFEQATAVTALTKDLHIVRGGSGMVIGIEAAINGTIATGADRTITVDLLKSTGGGAFASILTSTLGFDDSSTLRTAVAGVIASDGLLDGDILRATVAVAGSAGDQAKGLLLTLTIAETFA